MPEAYTHIRIARAARAHSGVFVPCTAAFEMGANGPDPLFAYRLLDRRAPAPLAALGGRVHREQCGRFLRTLIFAAATPAQRSYALGFLTHCAGDALLHPYVAFQEGPGGQFNRPHGHGFCEVAMDSMFHEKDTGSAAVPAATAAPRLAPDELAGITQLLHGALAHVYGETVSCEALADAFHDFTALHRLFCAPRAGKRWLVRTAEHFLHRPGWGQSHLTPAAQPAGGFAVRWENPYTHEVREAGPERLCAEAALLASSYLGAAAAYWEGRSIRHTVAMAIGDRSFVTGLMSEPAGEGGASA